MQDDNQQMMGAQSGVQPTDNPAMLDNVSGGTQQHNPSFTPMSDDNSSAMSSSPMMNQPMPAGPPEQAPMYQPPADHTHHYQPPANDNSQVQQQYTPAPPQDFTQQQHSQNNDDNQYSPDNNSVSNGSDLSALKRDAMRELEGLLDQIEGNPEQVFRTTMMLVQANDNPALLERALQAAKSIHDDKKRAEALLDVVSEINYFSQSQS